MPAEKNRNDSFVNDLIEQVNRHKLLLGVTGVIALVSVVAQVASPLWAILGWTAVCLAGLFSDNSKNLQAERRFVAPVAPDEFGTNETIALIAGLPDPCFLLHHDGRVIYQNHPAQDAVGEIEPGTVLFSLLRAPEIPSALTQLIRDRNPVQFEFVRRSQSERRFEVHMALIADKLGNRSDDRIVMSMRDLTQQQKLDQMRADFVANASHELRTPLASLIGFIETLQGSAKNDKAAREQFLEIMGSQAQRMSRLIDDLLSLNRIEMNVHVRPQERINFVHLVSHVIDTLKLIAKDADVKINLVIEKSSPARQDGYQVVGDRDELVQVVQNLVENAIKYGQDGKTVDISLYCETREAKPNILHLDVRDHGPGIAPEHLPRLTERFYRVDVVSSREKGGTGLGLAIVKHILNRHRGRLQIQSTLGKGACFKVTIEEAAI